jgi:hypothetical protein
MLNEIGEANAELYDSIMTKRFDDFEHHFMGESSYEDYCCKVDIRYRENHGVFPVLDEKMLRRLRAVAVEVGTELINGAESAETDWERELLVEHVAETLDEFIAGWLKHRQRCDPSPTPFNRRFERRLLRMAEVINLGGDPADHPDLVKEAFKMMRKRGFYKLIERGKKRSYDIFEAVDV